MRLVLAIAATGACCEYRSPAPANLDRDTALKPFPELFVDCFSEGKTWFNKTNGDAAAEWRENRKAFRDLQWFYERDYALRSVVGRYIGVVRSDAWFDGGA